MPRTRQYTIRSVPPDVDRALRERAQREGKSLNQAAVDALRRGLAIDAPPRVFRDLDRFIGTWVEDPAFDEAIREQDTIDEEMWR